MKMMFKGILTIALSCSVRRSRLAPDRGAALAAGARQSSGALVAVPRRSGLCRADRDVQDRASGARRRPGRRGTRRRSRAGRSAAGAERYTVTAIPGVIAAGQQWKFVWQEAGNNGDGIVGPDDGGLLLAQNDNSQVLKLDPRRQDDGRLLATRTPAARSRSTRRAPCSWSSGPARRHRAAHAAAPGAGRQLSAAIRSTASAASIERSDRRQQGRRVLHDGRRLLRQPERRGHQVRRELTPNGIILSANEKTLYVTNGPTLAAFDVQPDGSLTNQREFARLEGGGGDGSTIDAPGRVYVTTAAGVQVIGPDGKYLGLIPTPRGVITTAFGGKDKKTLFILARGARMPTASEVAMPRRCTRSR